MEPIAWRRRPTRAERTEDMFRYTTDDLDKLARLDYRLSTSERMSRADLLAARDFLTPLTVEDRLGGVIFRLARVEARLASADSGQSVVEPPTPPGFVEYQVGPRTEKILNAVGVAIGFLLAAAVLLGFLALLAGGLR